MVKGRSLRDLPGVFNELISARMKQLGLEKLDDFAEYASIPYTTLYNVVAGRVTAAGTPVKPSIDTLILLAKALDEPLHKLVYMLAPDAPGAEEKEVYLPDCRQFPVKVAGWVGAGPQQLEEINGSWVVVEEDFARGKQLQAFRVRGDSMAAGKRPIYDGDIVLVNTLDKGYNTAAVVARLQDGRYVCKALKDDIYGKLLQSRNVDHTNGTPSAIPIDQVDEIVGRVVRIIATEDSNRTR